MLRLLAINGHACYKTYRSLLKLKNLLDLNTQCLVAIHFITFIVVVLAINRAITLKFTLFQPKVSFYHNPHPSY